MVCRDVVYRWVQNTLEGYIITGAFAYYLGNSTMHKFICASLFPHPLDLVRWTYNMLYTQYRRQDGSWFYRYNIVLVLGFFGDGRYGYWFYSDVL